MTNDRYSQSEHILRNTILFGIVLAIASWIAAAGIELLAGQERYVVEALLPSAPSKIIMRSLVVLMVIGVSVYVGRVFARLKQSEKNLSESELRYRNLVEVSQDVIFTLAPDGMVTSVNNAIEQITGWKSEDVVGRSFSGLIHPDDLPRAQECFQQAMDGHATSLHELQIKTSAGIYLTGDFKTTPHIQDGKVIGILGVSRDISKRKDAEQAVQESESKYRDLLENAHDIIQIVSADGAFLFVNQAWRETLGYSNEEVSHLRFLDTIHPDYRAHCMDAFLRVSAGEQLDQIEAVFVTKQGRSIVVEGNINSSIVNGKPVTTRGIFRDITDHRQATAFIRNILESVDEGFTVISKDYEIISANKAYSEKVNLPLNQIIGKHCYEVSHRMARPCYESGEECAVRHTFQTGEPHAAIHIHYDKDGNPIYVETKSFPLRDSLGRIVSAIEIHNDVTEKKRLEDQLRHAQKMEAVGTLAGGIAHDFNNILTAIIGYGTLLQMKMGSGDPLRSFVDQILMSTERAANLTQSLLAFSRKQTINLKPVELNPLVKRVDKLVERLIGEDITISIVLTDTPLTVRADAGHIEQVLLNLVTNARDAMPRGGKLILETAVVDLDSEYLRLHGYGKIGRYALLSITDTGEGMDERTCARIFEPFFTTKEVGKGTGLGLSIVYGIIKQHGGYINVYSEPGEGTRFKIFLPLISASVETMLPVESLTPEGGMATILVAEDDESVRKLTRAVLEGFGYTVIEAVDGEDAKVQFENNKQTIDLLLLDIVMPKKSGTTVYEEIHRDRPAVKVLFTSGYSSEVIHTKGLLKDTFHFISKPVSPRDLLKKVKEVLDHDPASPKASTG